MIKKNFYQILNISSLASQEEIKKAYKKLVVQYHPDKNIGKENTEEIFKKILEAYETLSDIEKRKRYDQTIQEDISTLKNTNKNTETNKTTNKNTNFTNSQNNFNQKNAQNSNFDPTQNIKKTTFSEVINDVFNSFVKNYQTKNIFNKDKNTDFNKNFSKNPNKNLTKDLRYNLTISLEESANGCKKIIHFIRVRNNKEQETKLEINVPPGIRHDQKLKLSNEGDQNTKTGSCGDLYVVIKVKPHLLFKKIENDIILNLPISFTDVILGTTIEIPSLYGKLSLTIPPGTNSGQVFRLRNKGLKKIGSNQYGDMLINILIDVPENINELQKNYIMKLKEEIGLTPLIKDFQKKLSEL